MRVDTPVNFVATTWERGVHFDTNTHTVEFTCGAGGAGGATLLGGVGEQAAVLHSQLLDKLLPLLVVLVEPHSLF